VSTKDGDRLRVRYTVYLLDGTVVSRGAGVEQEFTLGRGTVPPGFENGVRDMKAGGERVLYIPAEAGWSSEYRDAALAQIKSCRGACALDEQPVIVFAKLEGYKKAECKGGDMPVSVKTGSLTTGSGFSDFKIEVSIGSDVCPEGDTEITEKRLKTLDMINKMKSQGRLKAAEPQPFCNADKTVCDGKRM